MVAKSADALVDLYAADAVHEFPFPLSGTPERYSGREQLRAGYREAWSRTLLRIDSIENFTVHETLDPNVIIAEQEMGGTIEPIGEGVRLPFLLVLRL